MAAYKHERPEGPATVLAIGTAVPPNLYLQSEYADYYFNVTNSNDKTALKSKFDRICQNSGINSRYLHLTEDILKSNPCMSMEGKDSLDIRQNIATEAVAKLGAQAAEVALKEWDQPREKITHVVFATTGEVSIPGADATVTRSLGLQPTVKRTMLYLQGCSTGGAVVRLAKDWAENNKGARVLTVISETTCLQFAGPYENRLDKLVASAVFGDGASAMIIGSDPTPLERPLYEIHWSGELLIPETGAGIAGVLTQTGLDIQSEVKNLVGIVCNNIGPIFYEAASHMTGSPEWKDLFWCVHPGIRGMLEGIQKELGLGPEHLQVSRDTLFDYGNMSGVTVHFILDRIRNQSLKSNASTTGNGAQWGLLVGIGPGMTLEVSVLRSFPISNQLQSSEE